MEQMNPGYPCLTHFITHLAAGYPLNNVFFLWFALLDTSDMGPMLLLLLIYVIMACTALVKFGTAWLSLLASLKAKSKEQNMLKEDLFSDLSGTNLSSVSLFVFPLHALAVLRHCENKVAFTKGTNIRREASLLGQTCWSCIAFLNLLSSTGLSDSEWQVCYWPVWQSHQEGEEARRKRKERMEGVGDAATEFWMTLSFFMWGFATNKARDQTNAASSLIQQWGCSCDSLWQIAAFLDVEGMKGTMLTRL